MEKFGKYVLVKLIAMGGMAEVFLAKEFGISGFQRILAIKRVLPHLARDNEFIEMFTGEARLSAQLTHPNIVQIFEFGLIEESYFLAMEYIDGLTLSDLLSRFAFKGDVLPLELALHIVTELCQGLEYAHNKRSLNNEPLNIVHRDISPKNAMLSYDGAVKLMDFGIAKATDQQRQETISGTIKGKISYLSPEQVMGSRLDRRSDIFSLAVVIWEMLTSRKCFSGDNEFAILYKIRMAEVAAPSTIRPGIHPELDAIILKALRGDREERYQTADELLNDLNAFRYKHGLLASTSKLAGFLRDMKASGEEDTLSSLQKIDWTQVEAKFGLSPTASLRAEQDTPAAEAVAAASAKPSETPGRGIRPDSRASDDAPRDKKPATVVGKDTSKKIRPQEGIREGARPKPVPVGPSRAGDKPRPITKKVRAEPAPSLADEFEGPSHQEEHSRLVPVLVALSVVLLVGTAGFFVYVLWPQFTDSEHVVTPTPVATAAVEPEATTPPPTVVEMSTPGAGLADLTPAAQASPAEPGATVAPATGIPAAATAVVTQAPAVARTALATPRSQQATPGAVVKPTTSSIEAPTVPVQPVATVRPTVASTPVVAVESPAPPKRGGHSS